MLGRRQKQVAVGFCSGKERVSLSGNILGACPPVEEEYTSLSES